MISILEVIEVYGVFCNYMVKIINQLSCMGYVIVVWGKNGGICFGKLVGQICVGDVVCDFEFLLLVNCSSEFCYIILVCCLKQVLVEVVQSFFKELDNYMLVDLVEKN